MPTLGAPEQLHEERRAPRVVTAASAAVPALLLAATAPMTTALLALADVLVLAALAGVAPRLHPTRETAAEAGAGVLHALALAGVVHTAWLPMPVVAFAAVVVGAHAVLCSLAWTSAIGVVGVAVAVAGAGRGTWPAVALGLGLLALGVAITASVAAVRRSRAAVVRQLQRMRGDLENRQSVETRLRETHESLERQAIALTDTNRRMEREIEVRRKAEEKALEAARTKDSFLRTVSHELRTPLNAVIGYAELLLEDDPRRPLAEVRGEHQRILESAGRLLQLIDDILDLSKIEAGKATLELELVDVAGLAEQAVAAVAGLAEKNENTIRFKVEDGLPPLHTDRGKLRQILLHMLGNACKFTHAGTVRLTIRLDQTSSRPTFCLEVADTGIGMAPEALDRIFAPFVQADGSTTRRYGGTGLGLAMCRHYCSMLGGDITATSTPGEGSTFTVHLPATRIDPRSAGVIVQSRF